MYSILLSAELSFLHMLFFHGSNIFGTIKSGEVKGGSGEEGLKS